MVARLPVPGSDDGAWGDVLNSYLEVEHTASGTLKIRTDGTFYAKPVSGVPLTDLSAAVQSSLAQADSALQSAPVSSVNTKTGTVVLSAADVGALTQSTADTRYVAASSVGQVNGVASLDSGGKIPTGQLPASAPGSLTGLSDVDATSPNDGDALMYDSSTSKWQPTAIAAPQNTGVSAGKALAFSLIFGGG